MHYCISSTSSKAIDLSSAWLLTGISPHLFDRVFVYSKHGQFEAEPDPEAGLPIPSSSASSANPQATTKSNLVRLSESNLSSALTQEGTVSGSSSHQYKSASDPDGQSQLK
jgi:hypothetical protein